MKVFRDMRAWRHQSRTDLGFVATMGALHEGHLSLVRASRAQNQETCVSLFVNPTQFDDPTDLRAYPRSPEADLAMLEDARVDYVLLPTVTDIYPSGYRYRVCESELSHRFCGAHRAGHFDGVLTVVLKLLMLAEPHRAYFGEKDYQQLRLIQGMVEDFFLKVEVVPVPIVREPDGLAMSSRNARLGPSRAQAALFPKLMSAASPSESLKAAGFAVDYVEEFEGRRLGAVRLQTKTGAVRLIDNITL